MAQHRATRQGRPAFRLLVCLLPCLLVFLMVAADRPKDEEPPAENKVWTKDEWLQAVAKLHRGMSAEEVQRLLPRPRRVARQILFHRYLEQWIYDEPVPLRLEFDCRKGQRPFLLTDQEALPPEARPARP